MRGPIAIETFYNFFFLFFVAVSPNLRTYERTARRFSQLKKSISTEHKTAKKVPDVSKNQRKRSSSTSQPRPPKKPSNRNKHIKKIFKSENILSGIIKTDNNMANPYECAICNIRYKNKKNLKLHITMHLNKFDHCFICSICRYIFDTQNELNEHLVVCEQNNVYRCIKIMNWDTGERSSKKGLERQGIRIYW